MEFEEFFGKKRIDLAALQKVEPGLFTEFKNHFALMGEKSFDHTKKYWFNKLRLQFPLAVEPKTEKVKIDNPLAEQTITESLIEETVAPSKLGFVPKFKAANISKPAEATTPSETKSPEEQPATTPAPKLGFTPKFKAASPPKTMDEQTGPATTEATPAPAPSPKLGFTPKFKAANIPKPVTTDTPEEEKTEEQQTAAPKLGFTPKFKASNMQKPAEEKTEEDPAQAPAPKLGFTPKFKAANMPKPATETEKPASPAAAEDTPAPENSEAKPAYKPRFNMKNLPKKEE